ncbi:hypothetical protein NFI96_024597, partial [Prochilodus magdalenae]
RGGENVLDMVYTNIPGAFRAEPRTHYGFSDHVSVMLIPAYRPLIRRAKTDRKQRSCNVCDSINLEDNTESVTGYISECIDNVTLSKVITAHPSRNHGRLQRVNPRKAPEPQSIPSRVLRECAEQLADVFTDIFNISLSTAVVPTCFKTTTIFPVPKKSTVSCLNDYRPVALTPIIMKCFERLVMRHIKGQLPPSLGPLQLAYRPNRSTDGAITTTLQLTLTHLDNKGIYVRMLLIDFSSAFITIIPQHLIGRLGVLGLNTSLCNWVLDFLTDRPQSVRIGHNISSTTTLSTGAHQSCVLSPLLFTLLTHDCAAKHNTNHIVKFADDTSVVGLITKNNETAYREEVQRLTDWCRTNNLSLNVDKTKEKVVDFKRVRGDHAPLNINGSAVEIVQSTKFLGVHNTENLTWSLNTSSIAKKAQQRLYVLRRLRKAHRPPPILTMF